MIGVDYEGMRITEVASHLGVSVRVARQRVARLGFICGDSIVRRRRDPRELQDEIAARIAAAPPSAPCFRCGAVRGCDHRNFH